MNINTNMQGYIKGIIGPMYGAKTKTMINDVERYHIANKQCIIIKYVDDKRYNHLIKNNGIVPHDGKERDLVQTYSVPTLALLDHIIDLFDVIGIDECQFFPDCVEYAQKWANMGKVVIWSALDGDSCGKPFGHIHELIPLCEDIIKLKAVCMKCYNDASFTSRISPLTNGSIVDIGGKDKYIAVCRQCKWKSTTS